MEFFVHAMGIKQAQVRFNRMGAAAIDARPAFETIADLIMEIEKIIFQSQGRRGGGSWKRLSDPWLKRKVRTGLDPRINFATHALHNAMTVRGDDNQFLHVDRERLIIGAFLPYAATAQKNRPFVKLTVGDRIEIRNVIRDHLFAAWRAPV